LLNKTELYDLSTDPLQQKNVIKKNPQVVDFLLGKDVELSTLEGLMGYDSHLDNAIELVVNEEKEEIDPDEEDNWDFDADDED
jgi:hypothetical protein